MRAVVLTGTGGPDVLRVVEVPDPPAPWGDELLVRVEASSVNGTDLGLRRGGMPVVTLGRRPFVPGFDLAGEVLARGPRVTAFEPGERVVALLGHGGGAQAELVLVRQGRAASAPRTVSAAEAATLPLAGLTALQALFRHGRLGVRPRGSRVLVLGASGGIGSFAVLLAAREGASVTGSASTSKLDHVRALGAEDVVDHQTQDVTALDGRWDVVLDAAGRHAFERLRPLLAPGGTVVSTRALGRDTLRLLAPARRRPADYAAVMTGARSQDLARLVSLVDRGGLRSVLDRTFALDAVADAHRWAESSVRGKVVLGVASP